jgi:broad specificity phosphatase PhoE
VSEPAPPPPSRRRRSAGSLEDVFLLDEPSAVELVLVRHGQQLHRDPGPNRWLATDPPLTDLGHEQAALVGAWLAASPIDAVFCSPLARARQTAVAIAAHHELEPTVLSELREVEVYRGLADGVNLLDVIPELQLRGAAARFARERRWEVFPQSESGRELRARVVTTIEGIVASRRGAGGRIAVVCHGGVINAYVADVLGLSEDMVFMPTHTSITRVRAGHGRRVVHTANEHHHLVAAGAHLVTY